MLSFGQSVQGCELLSGEPDSDDLHRLGAAAWTTSAATLQFLDVVPRLSLIDPLLDLLFGTHA